MCVVPFGTGNGAMGGGWGVWSFGSEWHHPCEGTAPAELHPTQLFIL